MDKWKALYLESLFALQALFIGTMTWDFIFTFFIETSVRASVIVGVSKVAAFLLGAIWLFAIVSLFFVLIYSLLRKDTPKLTLRVSLDYATSMFIYFILLCLVLFSSNILWPMAMNYFVNIFWAGLILYFRSKVIADQAT